MTCYAITKGGFGTVLEFESTVAAYAHPAVAATDAVMESEHELSGLYSRLEWPRLLRMVNLPPSDEVEDCFLHSKDNRAVSRLMKQYAPTVWERLARLAVPAETMEKEIAMSETVAKAPKEKKAKVPKEKKVKAVKEKKVRDGALDPEMKIQFGTDAEGKPYSASHPPSREGTKRAERFAHYRQGMTVAKAKEAGLSERHIKQNAEAGHIILIPPATADEQQAA